MIDTLNLEINNFLFDQGKKANSNPYLCDAHFEINEIKKEKGYKTFREARDEMIRRHKENK